MKIKKHSLTASLALILIIALTGCQKEATPERLLGEMAAKTAKMKSCTMEMQMNMDLSGSVEGFDMDMSFAIQALSAKYLVEHGKEMTEMLVDVPEEIDKDVAVRKLRFLGKEIDTLTAEQEAYLNQSLV